jgi:hypothetical protein
MSINRHPASISSSYRIAYSPVGVDDVVLRDRMEDLHLGGKRYVARYPVDVLHVVGGYLPALFRYRYHPSAVEAPDVWSAYSGADAVDLDARHPGGVIGRTADARGRFLHIDDSAFPYPG